MAKIVSEQVVNSTWNVPRDVDEIVRKISEVANSGPRTIVFVGETHNFGFDRLRNPLLVHRIASTATQTLVVERGMFSLDPKTYPQVITEADTQSKPSDPARNSGIVAQLVDFTAKLDPPLRARPTVFVFGQDHERFLKEEVEKQLADGEELRWVSFPSIDDQIAALPALYDPSQLPGGYTLLGYAASGDIKQRRTELEMRLLARGYVPSPFFLKLYSANVLSRCNPTAVYTNDPQVIETTGSAVEIDGTCELRVADANALRCKDVDYNTL